MNRIMSTLSCRPAIISMTAVAVAANLINLVLTVTGARHYHHQTFAIAMMGTSMIFTAAGATLYWRNR